MADDNDKKPEDDAATEADKATDNEANANAEAEDEGGEAEDGGTKKKSKKKMIIIIVAVLVLLIGGGAGAYFAGLFGGGHEGEGGGDEEGVVVGKPVYYTLPEFLVNLSTGGRSSSFLKTTIILEVSKEEDVPAIESNLPRLVDAVNTYLRELRASDLSGSAGIQRLREEMLIRANKSLAPVKINDVLFKEIVIQ